MSQDQAAAMTPSADTSVNAHESQRPNPGKTPIQILHEYGTRSGNLPLYVMEKAEGEAHQPSFVFSVKIGDISCTGQGPSKKAAKHMAAEAALNILHIDAGALNVSVKSESNGVAAETNNHANSVGILQELALQKRWRLPEYSVLLEAVPPHKREFTVMCRMESLSEKEFQLLAVSQDVDKSAALSHGLMDLSTEQKCSHASFKVRSEALTMFHHGKETSCPKQTSPTNTILGTYPITAAKKGICLIVNNYDFNKHLQNREGTMVDEECLQKVFKWLGFEVETHRDCKSVKILSVMQELGSRNHSQMDCVVCCVLSHGQEGTVYGVDGRTVNIRKLMEPFNGSNCSSLAGKPKLFFIQACQGTKEQKAVYIEADSHTASDVQSDATYSIPCDADFLLGMSTIPSFSSFRERKNGTWFIQSLCQNLVQMVPRGFDLLSILTKVNADVSQRTDSTGVKKQMPQPAFSLTKKVVFLIPKGSPPIL